jgi:hypothetical protein
MLNNIVKSFVFFIIESSTINSRWGKNYIGITYLNLNLGKNFKSGRLKMAFKRTLLVIFMLITSIFLVMYPNNVVEIAREAEADFASPNDGTSYTMTSLAAATANKIVYNAGGGVFYIMDDVTIQTIDSLDIGSGEELRFSPGVNLYINGTLGITGAMGTNAVFKENVTGILWGGIHLNASSIATVDFATISGAAIGLNVTGGSPIIQDSVFYNNNVSIRMDQMANVMIAISEVRNNMADGIRVLGNSILDVSTQSKILNNNHSGIYVESSEVQINDIEVKYNNGSGIYMKNSVNNLISYVNFTGNSANSSAKASVYGDNSNANITNCTFYNASGANSLIGLLLENNAHFNATNINVTNNWAAVRVDTGSSCNIKNLTIFNSSYNDAIRILSSSNCFFDNVTIKNELLKGQSGIFIMQSSGINISRLSIPITENNGINIFESSYINVTGANLSLCKDSAIRISNSDNISLDNISAYQSFTEGIYVDNSRDISINNSAFVSNIDGLELDNVTMDFINSTSNNNANFNLIIDGDSKLYMLNSTIVKTTVDFPGFATGDTSNITREWFINVFVTTDAGLEQAVASVNVTDDENNLLYDKLTGFPFTWYFGKVYWMVVHGSYQDPTGTFSDNIYNVSTSYDNRKPTYTVITADTTHNLWHVLFPNTPPSMVENIQPQETHNATPQITWDASIDTDPGDTISYNITIENATKVFVQDITVNEYYDIVTPLDYQNYTMTLFAFDNWALESSKNVTYLNLSNHEPTKPTITITPGSPNTDEDLVMTITTESSDPDNLTEPNELIRYTVKWFKDGVEQPALEVTNKTFLIANNAKVLSGLTRLGENWTVEVTPYDGHNFSWRSDGSSGSHGNGSAAVAKVQIGNRDPYRETPIPDVNMDEDTIDTSLNLKTYLKDNDTNDPTEQLTYSYAGNVNIGVSIVQSTGVVTLTPAANWPIGLWKRSENITFTLKDKAGKQVSDTVKVTVQNTNDPPVIETISDINAYEDKEFAVYLNGSDALDPDTLSYTANFTAAFGAKLITSGPGQNYFEETITNGKKIRIVPDNDMVGKYYLRYTLDDGAGESNSIETDDFTIEIRNVNDAPTKPVITSPKHNSKYVRNTLILFAGYSSDPDEKHGDVLSYTWRSDKDGVLHTPGNETTLDSLTVNTHVITLQVTDGTVSADSDPITVTIEEPAKEVVANVTLLSPGNNSQIDKTSTTLMWKSFHELADQFTYKVKFDTLIVPQTVLQTGVTATSYEVSGLVNQETYYWQVIPTYGGKDGKPSAIFKFKVDIEIIIPTPTAYLSGPVDDSTKTSTDVGLTWASDHPNKLDAGFYYHVYWDSEIFTVDDLPANKVNTTQTAHTLTGLSDNTRYYWTVVPFLTGRLGICTSDPPVWTFSIKTGVVVEDIEAYLISPIDGDKVTDASVTLKWDSDDDNAASYEYKVFISESLDDVLDKLYQKISKKQIDYPVGDGKTYYWTVIPVYQGDDGDCLSGVWHFDVDFGFVKKEELDINVSKNDLEIQVGDQTSVTFSIENKGNVKESLKAVIYDDGLGGVTVSPETLTLDSGAKGDFTLNLNVPADASDGIYTITVDFLNVDNTTLGSEEITVKVTKEPVNGGNGKKEEPKEEEGMGMAIGIAAIVIILVVLIIIFLLMKKKKGKEGEGEDEEKPEDERKEGDETKPGQARRPGGTPPGTPPGRQPSQMPGQSGPPQTPKTPPETPPETPPDQTSE